MKLPVSEATRAEIQRFEEAVRQVAFVGTYELERRAQIRLDFIKAKRELEQYIESLQRR